MTKGDLGKSFRPAGQSAVDSMETALVTDQAHARFCILLAVYNGAGFLAEQLQSYLDQTQSSWSLIASDDGSTDESVQLLHNFASQVAPNRVQIICGPKCGHFAHNFLHLIRHAPVGSDLFALSDQDDVWLPEKLTLAEQAMSEISVDTPALYCARTIICDEDLTCRGESAVFRRPPSFGNALVQSIGGGNTMVLNRAAMTLAREAAAEAGDIVAHDWWLYQLVSGVGGVVINDPRPVLKYRQHNRNQIGANLSYRAKLTRIGALLSGRFRRWNECNIAALSRSSHRFTDKARAQLDCFDRARRAHNPIRRLALLRQSRATRQGRLGTAALVLSCLIYRM